MTKQEFVEFINRDELSIHTVRQSFTSRFTVSDFGYKHSENGEHITKLVYSSEHHRVIVFNENGPVVHIFNYRISSLFKDLKENGVPVEMMTKYRRLISGQVWWKIEFKPKSRRGNMVIITKYGEIKIGKPTVASEKKKVKKYAFKEAAAVGTLVGAAALSVGLYKVKKLKEASKNNF